MPTLTGPTAGHPRNGPARRYASRPVLRVGVVRDASNVPRRNIRSLTSSSSLDTLPRFASGGRAM